MSRILRFFVCLGTLFFAGNALAAGYTCSSLPTYVSCQAGYYMTSSSSSTTYNGTPKTGNYCQPCSKMGSNYTCAGGTAAPQQSAGGYSCPTYKKYTSCSAGYYMTTSSTSSTYNGTPKAGNACRPCSVYGSNYTCAGGTAAPKAITINVKCQPGEYLPKGKTACETCTAGAYCPGGQEFKDISLVTGATSDMGRNDCASDTMEWFLDDHSSDDELISDNLYEYSAAGSSSINQCYLLLQAGGAVYGHGQGLVSCRAGDYCNVSDVKIYFDASEDRGLTDSMPTVGGATSCARGSISSSTGWEECRPCPSGTTTSGTGTSSSSGCNVTCSNFMNVATWVTPEWTPNYVSNSCKVASCVACTKGTGVASCTASTDGNKCTYTATCSSGYKNPTCNGSSCSCEVGAYTITLNATANGGTGGMSAVYEVPSVGWYSNAALTTSISSVTIPTKTNSVFNGYYSAQSGGTRYITNAGALPSNTTFSANTTLYAQYSTASCNIFHGSATMSISGNAVQCSVTCDAGFSKDGGTDTTTKFNISATIGTPTVTRACSARTSTVSFNANGGTGGQSANVTATYGSAMPSISTTAPTRVGYTFMGWYDNATYTSGIQYYTAAGASARTWNKTANTTLYAGWKANSYTCSAGQYLKAGATSCTTCTANSWCGGGTFSFNSGTDQGLNTCPKDSYPYSDAGASSENNCYKNATNTGSQVAPALPTGCAAQTVNTCTPGTCTYRIYKSGTTTSCTPTNCNQTHKACTSASKNYYLASGVAAACSSANASYPSSDGGNIASSSCYGSFSKTGSQVDGSVPTNCASVTSWNACTPGTCQYTKYASGTVKTDCTPTNCTKTVKSVTANPKYYANGTSCSACPSGYPNSDAGNSGGITSCYSNSKDRAWTGSQVNGTVPTNCNSVSSWNACSLPTCAYVAYSNSTGDGDGTIKSGCSTNNANCTKTVAAVTAKSGYYVSGTSCTACSGLASGMYPDSTNGNTGGASACRTKSMSGQVITTKNASSTTQCDPGTFKAAHTVNYGSTSSCGVCGPSTYSDAGAAACTACATANGYTNSGTTAASHAGVASCKTTCSGTQYVATAGTACVTVDTGYYGRTAASTSVAQNATLARTKCPSIYVNGAAATQESECAVQTTAGKYIAAAKDTEQTKCPAKNYCPSASVKYGATNSPTACPTADSTTARTTYPTDYLNPTLLSINNQGWSTGLGAITSCSANYSFKNDAGNFSVESVGYNATTGKYDVGGGKYYTLVNKGWYLVDKYSDTYCNTSTNRMYYHNVVECPANSYCPGYSSMPLCSTGTHNDEMGKYACSSLGNGYNSSPAKSGAATACYLTTTAGKFVAESKAAESTCTAGGWCAGGTKVNYESTGGRTLCSSLTGVSVSGGTYSSAAGSSANTACKYTAPNKTITGCATVTTNTVTYSGTAWPATTYGVTANGGYIISGNNTAAATCSQCQGAVWSAGGTATSCSACPAQTSGWTRNTGNGWSAVTQCNQTQSVGGNCSAGVLKQNATSTTAWGASTISTALQAKPGYIVSGQTCTGCAAGTYSAGGTATSCSACTGRTKYSAANASACSTVSTGYYTTGCNSSSNNCTGQSQCTSGTWCASGVQNQCSSLTGVSVSGGTYTSAAGSSANTACKYTAPNKTITGCATVTTNTVTYSGTAWPATTYGVTANGGYIISGNNTAAATCSQCGTAKYSAGGTATSCSSCPNADSGWTAMSPAGSSAYTACYEYQTPANCASGSVKRAASSATAYSSTISLLSTLKSKAGYYASTTATSCTICPAGSSCAASATAPTTCANWTYAASTGMSSCTACPALTSGWAKADSTGTGWKSHTSCVQTSPTPTNCAGGNLKQVAASNGATTWGASAVNSALSSKAGYYVNGTACSACTGATYYGGGTATSCTACPSIYTSNTDAAKSKIEQCQVKTTGGYYIKTAKDATQTECGSGNYCPSTTVAYGSTNTQTACPVPADHKRATIPAEYYASSIAGTSLNTWSKKWAAVTQCQVLNTYEGTRGSLYDYLTYNTTTQKYDVQGSVLWFKANPGYYLTTATGCGTYAYYGKAVECDKNAYCPGKDKVECNSSNKAEVQVEKFGLELCSALGNGKYATSDGGASANSTAACYLTTTKPNFVAAAGAAESACTAGGWCPGNVKVAYGSTGGRTPCVAGTYNPNTSSSAVSACVKADAGYYVPSAGASSQTACTGAKYSDTTGATACTACPTQSGVSNVWYWVSTGTHDDVKGCYGFYNNVALNNGSVGRIQCFWDKTKSQYDTSCGAMKDGLKCNATYYNAALNNNSSATAAYYSDKASVIANACTTVGKGYWSPADAYTRTQCPAGYRDGTAAAAESACTMNVAGGKFVKVAKESAASGTCDAGYAKAAHSVTYGNTSACAACTGATYAASTGQASCTACPTAKTYASAVQSYGYWNNGKDGDHTISGGCYVTMTGTLSNGSLTYHGCYLGTDGDYGNGGGKRCYVQQDKLKCNAGYYASSLANGYVWNDTRAGLLNNTCVGVGAGYYSPANVLTRSQCPTGLTTIGYGAGADEVTDCGRILHFGNDKLYLRSGKKTTPSLNVKIGDTTYYGNMTAGTGKGKLRLKSGSTTYSVHDDSM